MLHSALTNISYPHSHTHAHVHKDFRTPLVCCHAFSHLISSYLILPGHFPWWCITSSYTLLYYIQHDRNQSQSISYVIVMSSNTPSIKYLRQRYDDYVSYRTYSFAQVTRDLLHSLYSPSSKKRTCHQPSADRYPLLSILSRPILNYNILPYCILSHPILPHTTLLDVSIHIIVSFTLQ